MKVMTIDQLKKAIPKKYHPKLELTESRIDWDEGEYGARLFLSTADNWCWCRDTHLFSFDTMKELKAYLPSIRKCECQDCQIKAKRIS